MCFRAVYIYWIKDVMCIYWKIALLDRLLESSDIAADIWEVAL